VRRQKINSWEFPVRGVGGSIFRRIKSVERIYGTDEITWLWTTLGPAPVWGLK